MTPRPPVITIFTADTGHLSLAQAVAQALSHYQTHIVNASIPGFSIYYPFYRYFPQITRYPYKIANKRQVYRTLQKFLGSSYRLKIAETIATQRPDAVISTYAVANPTIESIIAKPALPFINIISDPWTIAPFLPSALATNLVFDQTAFQTCRRFHIPKERLIISGWFIRPAFKSGRRLAQRQALHLPPRPLTFLVAAGSEGTNLVLKIMPTFLQTKTPLTIIVACGHNRRLFDIVTNLNRFNRALRKHPSATLIPLSFTDQLHRYMQAADLVIGKSGPNLLFETVATETPFFAVTHISGQEDGNLDIIRDYHLGYVEENLIRANRLLKQIIAHPQALADFTPSLHQLATHNAAAPKVLVHLLTQILT
ncbi:hypothetical protein A2W24_05445 [Microgenomates group bacterium RBG_16_45_19]|nr:MAG: hypothetical protein A2W24_05445 [Microgenomates group bacterium RBG_16_45_19]